MAEIRTEPLLLDNNLSHVQLLPRNFGTFRGLLAVPVSHAAAAAATATAGIS